MKRDKNGLFVVPWKPGLNMKFDKPPVLPIKNKGHFNGKKWFVDSDENYFFMSPTKMIYCNRDLFELLTK